MTSIRLIAKWYGMTMNEELAACTNALAEPILHELQDSAVHYLCREALASKNGHPNKEAKIPAVTLRKRLPGALAIIKKFAKADKNYAKAADRIRPRLIEIVAFCKKKEKETKKPCTLNLFLTIR